MEEIIKYHCNNCGNDQSIVFHTSYGEYGKCTVCHRMTFKNDKKTVPKKEVMHCPYCSSIDVKKISTASKVGSVALWGVFAVGKVSKQWHCNNCKSDF